MCRSWRRAKSNAGRAEKNKNPLRKVFAAGQKKILSAEFTAAGISAVAVVGGVW